MKRKGLVVLLGGLALGLVLGALVFFGGPAMTRANQKRVLPPTVGSAAADFDLLGLEGENIKLSDYRGKPVVVNFWATWCGPCREEMPLLENYQAKYGDRLVILGVNVQEDPATVYKFAEEVGIHFPIVLDRNGNVARLYYVHSYPATLFVDSEGVIRAQHLGQLSEELLVTYMKTVGITP